MWWSDNFKNDYKTNSLTPFTILGSPGAFFSNLLNLLSFQSQHSEFQIFSPKVLRYPNTDEIWYAGGRIGWKRGETYINNLKGKTEFIPGCSMFVRNTFFVQYGLLDVQYFAYFEDVDISVRANTVSRGCYYEPKALIFHRVERSMCSISMYYYHRNRFLFMKKNGTFSKPCYFYSFYIYNTIINVLRLLFMDENCKAKLLIGALIDGILLKKGKKKNHID